jgi:hypothetical protein
MINVDDILSDTTARDFNVTYADTYLQFKTRDDDGWYPAKVIEASTIDGSFVITVEKVNGHRVFLDMRNPSNSIKFDWPELGYINFKDHSVYIERTARRQWKKGLRQHCIQVTPTDCRMLSAISHEIRGYDTHFSDKGIAEIFNPTYTSLKDAIELVVEGEKIARCISPHFAISSYYDIDKPVVMYRNNIVGIIEDNKLVMPNQVNHLIPMLRRIVPNGLHNSILLQP